MESLGELLDVLSKEERGPVQRVAKLLGREVPDELCHGCVADRTEDGLFALIKSVQADEDEFLAPGVTASQELLDVRAVFEGGGKGPVDTALVRHALFREGGVEGVVKR